MRVCIYIYIYIERERDRRDAKEGRSAGHPLCFGVIIPRWSSRIFVYVVDTRLNHVFANTCAPFASAGEGNECDRHVAGRSHDGSAPTKVDSWEAISLVSVRLCRI